MLVLPGTATLVVPVVLLRGDLELGPLPLVVIGLVAIALGVVLAVQTIALFATFGHGTLAPWDPPERLVVRGPYRRVRNPMITGVGCILFGEAALFASWSLLVWAAGFATANAIYIPLVEEPRLRARFGRDYDAYRADVPRWIPRL